MSTALDHVRPVASPGRISQGTAIEQSRAIAQVQAMVIVAQQCPRSVPGAIRAMEEACRQTELAEKAFFRFPRAGGAVEGPSVHLARELARCWGNIEHGVSELRRDDLAAESEMQAFAWDLETNTRSASIFIVPHKRDTKTGVKDLTDMRDIYENNANNGARRLREAIFSTLPVWYRARAEKLCRETLESGGGRPLAQRIADAVTAFERYRVSPARLAAKFGYAGLDELTAADVAQLGIIYDSLRQGTVTVDDEFPPEQPRVTAADITGQQDAPPPPPEPAQRRGRKPKDDGGTTGAAPAGSSAQAPQKPPAPAPAPERTAPSGDLPPLPGEDEPDPMTSGASSSARAPGNGSLPQTGGQSPSSPGGSGTAPDDSDYDTPGTYTKPQLTRIWATLTGDIGYPNSDKDAARKACAGIIGRDLASSTDLSFNEAGTVIDTLGNVLAIASGRGGDPRAILEGLTRDPRAAALTELSRIGITSLDGQVNTAGQVLSIAPPASLESLTTGQAVQLAGTLARCTSRTQLDALLATGEVPGAE